MSLVGRVEFPQLDMRVPKILEGNSWSRHRRGEAWGVFGKWLMCLGEGGQVLISRVQIVFGGMGSH